MTLTSPTVIDMPRSMTLRAASGSMPCSTSVVSAVYLSL
jgi:hypothetical protein